MYQHVYKKAMCVNIKERCLVCDGLPCVSYHFVSVLTRYQTTAYISFDFLTLIKP